MEKRLPGRPRTQDGPCKRRVCNIPKFCKDLCHGHYRREQRYPHMDQEAPLKKARPNTRKFASVKWVQR